MNFPLLGNIYPQLLLLLPFAREIHMDFSYDMTSVWPITYPTCRGLYQSPVAINIIEAYQVLLLPLRYVLYDELLNAKLFLHNNGHTVGFEVPTTSAESKPFIVGGPLNSVYETEMVHFHWGSPESNGSEHILNGRQYDLEMHIVHKNVRYSSIEEARKFKDGLVVLGVLFKVVQSDNVDFPGLNEIYNALPYVLEYNSTHRLKNQITLDSLLANINLQDYFIYSGSLTTPPCSEVVTWLVYADIVPISNIELEKFWNLQDSSGAYIRNNFRPTQPLGKRKIYYHPSTPNYIF